MKRKFLLGRRLITIVLFTMSMFIPSFAQSMYLPTSDLLFHANYMTKKRNDGQQQRFLDDKFIHINGCTKKMDILLAETGEITDSFRYSSYNFYPPCADTGWSECWIFSIIKQHPQDDLQSVALFINGQKREIQFMMMFSKGVVIYDIDNPQKKDCY